MIIICAVLLWGHILQGAFRIEWFVYAQTAATGITAIAALWATITKSRFFRPRLKIMYSMKLLKSSYPFAVLTVLMTLYTRIDSLMLERLLPDGAMQAGIYASAYRLLDASAMVAVLLAGVLLPVFSRQIAEKEDVSKTASMSARLLFVPGILLVLISFFYRSEIMAKLYPASTEFSAAVFGLLMAGFMALSLIYVYGTLLTANGNLKFLNGTAAAGVIGNIVLNLLLIYRWGALGAVIATLCTQGLVGIAHTLKAHRMFKIKYTLKELLQMGSFLAVAVVTFGLGHRLGGHWLTNILILTAFNLTFAVICGLVRPSYILQILNFNNKNESIQAERK
jgi:O-antigen/teichoic acid export membrane protein